MMKMVQANEKTVETLADGSRVTMEYVANGSFVQVQHRGADNCLIFNRHYMHGFDAAVKFAELTA